MAQKRKLVFWGRPITKKNHGRLVSNKRTGKPIILPSQQYTDYLEQCTQQMYLPENRGEPFEEKPVRVEAHYWMPNRAGWPDLIGLLQSTSDILEALNVIKNDKFVLDYDGSCIEGVDKKNPRVEILITEGDREPWK